MKKGLKLVPFALAALMLVGCSSKPIGPVGGDGHIVNENTLSYQEYYEEMYEKHNGNQEAAKELIFKVAKDVVENSETFKKLNNGTDGVKTLIEERHNKALDDLYTSQYKKNGLFNESLLVADLSVKGYDITPKNKDAEGDFFEETPDTLVGYKGLHSVLKYDYTDYLQDKCDYDIYLELLKEEYILSQKQNYFDDKRVRKVQFFKYSVDTASKAEVIQNNIEDILDNEIKTLGRDLNSDEFEKLAQTKFQDAVNAEALDNVAKDYAIINDKLQPGDKYYEKCLLDEYQKEMNSKKDEAATPSVETKKLTDKEKEDVVNAYNTYTNNGAYSKEQGYLLKQLDVKNNLGYKEGFLASDDNSTSLVHTDIDSLIKKTRTENLKDNFVTVKNGDQEIETSILDATGSNSKVFKKENTYYVVRVEHVYNDVEKTNVKDIINGAGALTKNTTNVKNAVAYYLEQYKVNLHEETLYNYLKDTFGFSLEKK